MQPLTLTKQQRQEIKKQLGSLNKLEIKGLDLHFGGHNRDHLQLAYKLQILFHRNNCH
ncbi:hypothetical protein SD927_05495 [Lactobacillus iners]|jgi:conserved domain protein|uniref:hypothetical protein n=1 Tax=Lactobacillus iners TaxID=147802 RepID=UPI0001E5DB5A|nr:hypothetical protein [Lactobacillus iners]EFO67774.1 hypothetical protein HMPREF9213_1226 [Lactobacillus iners LactinV 09V1-c]EFO72652.1 hypothetical protein HMPREF9215_0567 [Lactobacillus iners SPIN 2503V10-D]EGC79988.1 conserved domain protein [Lactobacillus iners UPII 143-D]EGG32045.1 hypothetical protein HMPREF9210_0321 [Lactobacillus iners SPIN 1401G]EFQ47583.1 hypothetical protein HMPREF9216_0415 [Lactobacillus iners LEAF 2053A-b]